MFFAARFAYLHLLGCRADRQKRGRATPSGTAPPGFLSFSIDENRESSLLIHGLFLSHLVVTRLDEKRADIAEAYLQQGNDFFEAAQNPRFHSRPLLYYYALLNVVKASLLIRKTTLPPAAKHGITDPQANSRVRLRFSGQSVRFQVRAANRSEIFPEFLAFLGYRGRLPRNVRVLELLKLIPSIHRTYVSVKRCSPMLLPVWSLEVLQDNDGVWVRTRFRRDDKDVREALPSMRKRRAFRVALQQVEAQQNDEIWFETPKTLARGRGLDNGIAILASRLKTVGMAAVMTLQGYRWYFVDAPPRAQIPYLAAAYAAIFYLGSITRYRPDVFDKIIAGKDSWIIEEFLATQPTQFLYTLASELAGVDVVRPYASAS